MTVSEKNIFSESFIVKVEDNEYVFSKSILTNRTNIDYDFGGSISHNKVIITTKFSSPDVVSFHRLMDYMGSEKKKMVTIFDDYNMIECTGIFASLYEAISKLKLTFRVDMTCIKNTPIILLRKYKIKRIMNNVRN